MAGKVIPSSKLKTSPLVKVITCEGCGSSIKITALGHSLIAVCSACGTTVDATDENLKVLNQNTARPSRPPVIRLKKRGKLHGSLWECIGYMERSDTKEYYWWEYLLFNPRKGFRWLSENNGHWSWIKPVKMAEWNPTDMYVYFLNKRYTLFHTGEARINFIAGEFYWRAQVGDLTEVKDYISPPEILSLEKSKDELIWSIGEYIEKDSVQKAFEIVDMPLDLGVAPNQPSKYKNIISGILGYWVLFFSFLFIMQIIYNFHSPKQLVYQNEFKFNSNPSSGEVKTQFVTENFELNGRNKNLQIEISSNVLNDWLSSEFELVNNETGDSEIFEMGVEYYYGYDGEHWTEGSQRSTFLLKNIPEGNYHFNLTPTVGNPSNDYKFHIIVHRGVPEWFDFFWYLFWISIFPIIILLLESAFEQKRWRDSDFSNYHGKSVG